MKPISLCLTHMGKSGLELVKSYPDVLPNPVLKRNRFEKYADEC